MNLKDIFATKQNPPELYWSLVLEPGWVQAGIWYIKSSNDGKDSKAEIISTSPATPWEAEDELLGSVDASLSSCIQKLPEEFPEPQKTVFGVSSSWVEKGEIKDQYLSKIKKICSELSLLPTGFVVLPEGIAHLFKSEEGAPLNAVVLGLGKENLELSIFKLGNLVGTSEVARSVSLVEDVIEGLSRFESANPLPSRIIVYDGREGEVEEARDTLSNAAWDTSEKVKFLHTPKVEILSSDKKVLATSLAGAAEIANVSKIETQEPEKMLPEDIPSNVQEVENPPSAQEFGFFVDKDVHDNVEPNKKSLGEEVVLNRTEPHAPTLPVFNIPAKLSPNVYLEKTKNLFHSLYGKLSSSAPGDPGRKKGLTALFIVLGIIIVGVFSLWWFLPKATVSIYVAPKRFEEEFKIAFDPGGSFDVENGVVPGEIVEANVSGDKTKSATGSKLIGEKSKGTVQIQNGTATPINLTAGTIIFSAGNLKFSLDNSASVSAALSPSSPGTAAIQVTAESIGAEYNLAKDETFKVGNYPKAEVDAMATSDFSGGSSREISAVSVDDRDKLETELKDELTQNAKTEIQSKLSLDKILVDELVEVTSANETFNHKVGDEADSLKLSLEIDAKAVAADKEKLGEFVREKLKDKVPQGFVLRESQIDYSFVFESADDGKYVFTVKTSANFLPEVKQDEIIRQISGRVPDVVEKYLSSIPGFTRAEIKLNPHFPGRFGTLPRIRKNISIEIVAEK
ncbi:MAG: baseplate J/gp47 family protein [Microgenomates group bacterium]